MSGVSKADVSSNKAACPVGKYPHAKTLGNLVFLSGIGPRSVANEIPGNRYDANGKVLDYDITQQTHAVFANVRAVLSEVGLDLEDLIDVTVFLTDMKRDFPTYNQIWAEYFTEHAPTRTTVGVSALPTPIAIEFKCIAALRG